jgi:hypothetical protein
MYELNEIRSQHVKANITHNMEIGKFAEMCISWFIANIWKTPINHTDFDRYEYGDGADFWNRDMKLWGEVKNLSGEYYVDRKWVQEEIINRPEKWAKIKILFISYIRAIPKLLRDELELNGWIIIEFGRQITSYSWGDVIQRLSTKLNHKVWSIYYQYIQPYIPKYTTKHPYIQSRIDESSKYRCSNTNSKLSTKNIFNNTQHGWYTILVSNRLIEGIENINNQKEIIKDNNKPPDSSWIKNCRHYKQILCIM